MALNSFDLREFAAQVPSSADVPHYKRLCATSAPRFHAFIDGLRERALKEKEQNKDVFVVLGTGGTFQSRKTPEGYAPIGTLRESFDALRLAEDPSTHLELCDLMNVDSSQMTVVQWRFLAEMIIELEQKASDAYDGIIVTHGTDTMAKGAAYLSFMLKGFPKSIIFTGSQNAAVEEHSDARDHMERSIMTAKIACKSNRRIAEVMVCCGERVSRGVWATKLGDKTINAFGSWNQPYQDFDATDWDRAARDGTLHRAAPALLDFSTGKGRGTLEFSTHAIDYGKKGAFEPFTRIDKPADLFPTTLTDKSTEALARHIIQQRVAILTQLGSATADNRLVEVALEAGRQGKIVLFEAPFHDSTVEVGTYKAGSRAATPLENIQRSLPILNTSPAAFEAKTNFLLHKLHIKPVDETVGLGTRYSNDDIRCFYDHMEQSLVGELV